VIGLVYGVALKRGGMVSPRNRFGGERGRGLSGPGSSFGPARPLFWGPMCCSPDPVCSVPRPNGASPGCASAAKRTVLQQWSNTAGATIKAVSG